jgi:pimeloyl-[acyl-carrier protein] methyl ester esterase
MVQIKILYCKEREIKNNLVLLHGWGWNMNIWHTLLPELQKFYNLICIDFSVVKKETPIQSKNYLEQIVNQILPIIPYQSIFLGWSLGGIIASWMALNHPCYVKKLILVTYSPRFMQDGSWPGIQPKIFKKFSDLLEENIHLALQYFIKLQCYGDIHINKRKNNLFELFLTKTFSLEILKEGLQLLHDTDFRQEFFNIQVPILLLYGQMDQIVPIEVAKTLKKNKLKAKVVILKGAGHLPFLSNPQWFYAELYKFIEGKKIVTAQ